MKSAATISVTEAWQAVQEGRARLIDVREPGEFETVRAPDSLNYPLSSLDEEVARIPTGYNLMILCASGSRAVAASKILSENGRPGVIVDGGIIEWTKRRLPTERGRRRVWSMDRQVRFGAGTLVLAGLGLGWFVHPGYFLVSAFVGCGLIVSGLTGFCGMALILARMPWNRASR